jgi:hypothetical protein
MNFRVTVLRGGPAFGQFDFIRYSADYVNRSGEISARTTLRQHGALGASGCFSTSSPGKNVTVDAGH